jgi:proteasome accessory factor B
VDQVTDVISYTSELFEYPADFSLTEYMADSWGVINDGCACKVRLKFAPEVAHRVKNLIYHQSQKIEGELEDGSIVISFGFAT